MQEEDPTSLVCRSADIVFLNHNIIHFLSEGLGSRLICCHTTDFSGFCV